MSEKIPRLLLVLVLMTSGLYTGIVAGSIATSEPPTDEFMAENAEIIAICEVTSIKVETDRTVYTLETSEAIKGIVPKKFNISTGEGAQKKTTPKPVRFEAGKEYVVYLCEENGKYAVFWEAWGKTPLSAFNTELLEDLRDNYKGTIELDVHPVFFIFLLLLSCVLVYFFWARTSK